MSHRVVSILIILTYEFYSNYVLAFISLIIELHVREERLVQDRFTYIKLEKYICINKVGIAYSFTLYQ